MVNQRSKGFVIVLDEWFSIPLEIHTSEIESSLAEFLDDFFSIPNLYFPTARLYLSRNPPLTSGYPKNWEVTNQRIDCYLNLVRSNQHEQGYEEGDNGISARWFSRLLISKGKGQGESSRD
jgi:hypothetical protein